MQQGWHGTLATDYFDITTVAIVIIILYNTLSGHNDTYRIQLTASRPQGSSIEDVLFGELHSLLILNCNDIPIH